MKLEINDALLNTLSIDIKNPEAAAIEIENILYKSYFGDEIKLMDPTYEVKLKKTFEKTRKVYQAHPVGRTRLKNKYDEWESFKHLIKYVDIEPFEEAFNNYCDLQSQSDGEYIMSFDRFIKEWENYTNEC